MAAKGQASEAPGLPARADGRRGLKKLDLPAIGVLLLVTLPWWWAVGCPFTGYDDPIYVTNNPLVLGGLNWGSFKGAFAATTGHLWLPATWISLALDVSLFGTGPVGFHLTNVVLHVVNTVLLYLFLRQVTGMPGRSLLVAALFSVHPLRVESVAWVTERKDVLSGLLGLLALMAYARFVAARGGKRVGWYAGMCGLYLLSLMAKPTLVTMPVLLLLMDVWPLRRWRGGWRGGMWLVLEKVPAACISAAIAVVTLVIQREAGALAPVEKSPMLLRLANAVLSYSYYLRDTVYFGGLSFYYPVVKVLGGPQMALAAAVVMAVVLLAVVLVMRKAPGGVPFAVGMAWFFVALLPNIGIIQSGAQSRADRFTYWPSIGLWMALVWVLPAFRTRRGVQVGAAVGAAAVVVLAVCMWTRLMLWRDPLSLYVDGMMRAPGNGMLEFLTGVELEQENQFREAEALYRRAVADMPGLADAHLNLGSLLVQTGREEEGWREIARARELAPEDPLFEKTEKRLREVMRERAATRGR